MNFNKVNNIVGWIVCVFACAVYIMTMEPTGSFWDCGEFVSSCYKLQIPHPPGAPLFVLLGRFFIILFGDSPTTAARGVNFMSAMMSGFSILFLFWSITHFARKLVQKGTEALNNQQLFTIMSAGIIGAIAYAFCDSFWYSAVEGEVYASSAFFTALVFWAMLKWEHQADQPGSDKWLIFIFYVMGMSIGVHLLNLLTIPSIVMIYYFRRYKSTPMGALIAFFIGCVITGFVQKAVIQYTISGAAGFDIFFVNSIGLPFFSGFAFFFIMLAVLIWLGIRIATKNNFHYLKLGLWSLAFMLLGYSTYFTTMIRSNADPAIDMFNVDNPVTLEGYLNREQYGDWPITYGPDFTYRAPQKSRGELYVRGKEKYEVAGRMSGEDFGAVPDDNEVRAIQKAHPDWDVDKLKPHFFPRMWDNGNDRGQLDVYHVFAGMSGDEQPTMADNIKYFIRYQNYWMYLRYFLWSYSGKQNDLQGFGNARDGNAISGIPFIDNIAYGDQSKMPDTAHVTNKSYNRLFLLPLILGFLGVIFQYTRSRKDFLIAFLLFFFTGFAIVIYLNQAGQQPRERDYAYAGSCYAFAIWIGLGVMLVKELFEKFLKAPMANYVSAGLCFLAVPFWMGTQEWDDHDRSKKTLARDLAKDYLESCPPNAILFSFGDNDTYPLWYAQEVEGIRPDVRVVVNSLLGTDWYMNQLRYKVNGSAPFDVIFTPEQIQGNKLNAAYYAKDMPGFDQTKYYDLYAMLRDVVSGKDPKYTQTQDEDVFNLFPVHKFSVPVDAAAATASGLVRTGDSVVSELHIDVPPNRNYLLKNDLAIYAIIASSKWKRPICFTSTQELNDLGIQKYVRLTGLTYELVPVENSYVDNETAFKNIMEKFGYGNADKDGVYFDEENRRHLNTIRLAHAQVAMSLSDAGKKDSARQVLEHFDTHVKESNFPYGMTSNRGNQQDGISVQFLQACYMANDLTLAKKVSTSVKKDLQQQMRYYKSLGDGAMSDEQIANNAYMLMQGKGGTLADKQMDFVQDIVTTYRMMMQISELEKQYAPAGTNPGGLEKGNPVINNSAPPPVSDSKGKKK